MRLFGRFLIEVCSEVEASRHGLRLLDAIETYEPDRLGRKAKFESYAISKIW